MDGIWRSRLRHYWRGWVQPILIVVILLSTFRSAVADWNDVPTGSMKPTIQEGDRIFVNKLAYDLKLPFTRLRLAEWNTPDRGDVVVFDSPVDGRLLVKRVVGLPGDEVSMLNNQLLINAKPVRYQVPDAGPPERSAGRIFQELLGRHRHPITITPGVPSERSFGPKIVPEGHYFMMGDNRDHSLDSRSFGFVAEQRILGQATMVALSFDVDSYYWPRWHRFFTDLP